MSDYPDFLRVEQWVGSPLLFGNQANLNSGVVFGPFFVGPWEQVAFYIRQIAGAGVGYTAAFRFYDAVGGNLVNTVQFGAQANGQMADLVATQSLYMTVTLTWAAGVKTFEVDLIPRRGVHPASRLFGQSGLLTLFGTAVGAGATITQILDPVCACSAVFSVATTATAWTCELREQDSSGATLANIASLGTFAGRGLPPCTVNLPPNPVLFSFTNGDGVGRTVDAGVFPLRA